MNRKNNIAARIEKSRAALLRLVSCCFVMAAYFITPRDRPLPRRVSRWVSHLLCTMEKATGYLLIAALYTAQEHKRRSLEFENAIAIFAASNKRFTQHMMSVRTVTQRLQSLKNMLVNLHKVAHQLARKAAIRAYFQSLSQAAIAMSCGQQYSVNHPSNVHIKNPIPP